MRTSSSLAACCVVSIAIACALDAVAVIFVMVADVVLAVVEHSLSALDVPGVLI